MRKIIYLIGIIAICSMNSCKSGLVVGETKVPFEKVCGSSADYKCRATGMGPQNTKTFRIYEKERPRCLAKSVGSNYCNLGRTVDKIAHNYPGGIIIELEENEIKIDSAKVDYDLKKDNISDIIAELDASLKENNIPAEISVDIKNEFKKELDNHLKIEAYLITYSVNATIIDEIRKAHQGEEVDNRFINSYNRLKGNGQPFVREVKIVQEICSFSENRNINNLLNAVLKAKLGEGNAKSNGILNATLSKKKTSEFSSSFQLSSIYSYGYWIEPWM